VDLIVTHNNADFDALGSAVAAHRLYPDSRIILPGSHEHAVRRFLSLAKDEIDIETEKTCDFRMVRRIVIVDTRHKSRIGRVQELLKEKIEVHIYDHHPRMSGDIKGDIDVFEEVGATITILVNILRKKRTFTLTPLEATIMLLGIYEETGSLTYRSTTRADVDVVSFLLGRGANLQAVSSYLNRQLSENELAFLVELINRTENYTVNGISVTFASAEVTGFAGELGTIVHKLDDVENVPVLFVVFKKGNMIRVLARSRDPKVDVNKVLKKFGGGGHKTAATVRLHNVSETEIKEKILVVLRTMIRVKVYAKDIMSTPVKTISCGTKIAKAKTVLKKLGIKGVPCVTNGVIRGLITMGDMEKAIRHNLGHSRVTGYMRTRVYSVKEKTPLHIIQRLMFEKNIGRLPVIKKSRLVGIVTRTDVLKRIHGDLFRSKNGILSGKPRDKRRTVILNLEGKMRALLPRQIIRFLRYIGRTAEARGYASFVVGGFVRDVLLGVRNFDVDIVVEGDAVALGGVLAKDLKGTLVVHKKFGTATVISDWPRGIRKPSLAGPRFKIDIATARKEQYERPASLPTVEFSSLKDDLSRRDFSINAMAVSLNAKTFGQLIDFFNGLEDLKARKIRVLHEASFIDDPTRIFRAVRFEQRLSFRIDAYTEKLIRDAVKEKMFRKTENQRIRDEILLILKEMLPIKALRRMHELHELRFIHRGITLNRRIEDLFRSCHKIFMRYSKTRVLKRTVDLYAMYLMVFTDGLNLRQIKEICSKYVLRRSDRLRLISYKRNNSKIIRILSSAKEPKPSAIYKLLEPLSYEAILVILAKAESARCKRRVHLFLEQYGGVRIKTRGYDLMRLGLAQGPVFKKILSDILFAKLEGKIRTKKDETDYTRDRIKRYLGKRA